MHKVIGLRNIGVVDIDSSGLVIDSHIICNRDLSIKLSNISAVSIVRNPMNVSGILLGLLITMLIYAVIHDEIARIVSVMAFICFSITNVFAYLWGRSCNILIVTNSAVVFRIANQSESFLQKLKIRIEKAMILPDDNYAYEAVFASQEIRRLSCNVKRIAYRR